MRSGKKSRASIQNGLEEGLELNKIDINPQILDLMVRETFAMFDENNSGDIDKNEFSKLTEALGLELTEKKQNNMMKELDKEGNGCIGYNDFMQLMSQFQFGNAQTHLESAFNEYDKDMDGEIGIDDLIKVSEELDEVAMSKSDAELMIAFFKYFSQEQLQDNDDEINLDEVTGVNITKKEFITTLTKIQFLVNKSENNIEQSQDLSKSRGSGFYDKSGVNSKSIIDKSFDK